MAGNTRRGRTRRLSGGKQPRSSARAGHPTHGPSRRARERAVAFHLSRSRSTTIHSHIRGRLRSAEALDACAGPAVFASRHAEVVRPPPGEWRLAVHRKNSSRARRATRRLKDRETFATSSKKILIHTAKTSARWLPRGHQNYFPSVARPHVVRPVEILKAIFRIERDLPEHFPAQWK